MLLKGEPYTIIGVLPESATTPLNADLYTALQPSREGEGMGTNFQAITRLRDGANWQQADAEMNRAWSRSLRVQRFVKSNPGAQITYYSVPLQKGETDTFATSGAGADAGGRIHSADCLREPRRADPGADAAPHRRDSHSRWRWAHRRWQIQRQLWIENLLLALLGGTAGIGVGFLATARAVAASPGTFSARCERASRQPRPGLYAFPLLVDQRLVRHVACSYHQESRLAVFDRQPFNNRWR